MIAALPVIDGIESCDGCGACCMEQSSPPGYVALLSRPGATEDWPHQGDVARLEKLPTKARVILKKYIDRLLSKSPPLEEQPCCWLDMMTLQCRFYDHRPQICRDFKIGSVGCLGWREDLER